VGADIQQSTLVEQQGPPVVNLLQLQLAVWMMNPNDNSKVYLPDRTYMLLISLVPHLISPATISDPRVRKSVLNCANTAPPCGNFGIVIELAFFNLLRGTPVDCHSSNYDLVDQQVLTAVLQFFNGYKDSSGQVHAPGNNPIVFSADAAVQQIGTLLASSPNVIGMDLGTDNDLKLGLLFGDTNGNPIGTPFTFDWQSPPLVSQDPPVLDNPGDWGLQIDTSLVTPSIIAKATAAATATDSSVTVTGATISYSASGIVVVITGTKSMGVCGSIPFTAEDTITPSICSCTSNVNANLRMCPAKPITTPKYKNPVQEACAVTGGIFDAIGNAVSSVATAVAQSFQGGLAVATAGPGPGPCPDNSCTNLGLIKVPLGSDTLYPIQLYVNGAFYLGGRSHLLDTTTESSRATLPASCP
jgi:hypothetical protein